MCFSIFRTIKGASPSDPASARRLHSRLRAGEVCALAAERVRKISAAVSSARPAPTAGSRQRAASACARVADRVRRLQATAGC